MSENGEPRSTGRRGPLVRLVARLGLATLALFLAALLPDVSWLLPRAVLDRPFLMGCAGLAAAYRLGRVLVRRDTAERARLAWLLGQAAAAADAALAGGMTTVLAATCVAYLATWVPHYVLWPWDRDADTFATLAMSWDAGILPYRDIRGYNFPGSIYLHWILGHSVGWGRTWALYALDAACLIGLGVLLAVWSRRTFGRSLPGVASYTIFLTFYLDRDFQLVAGRDWQTSLCISAALMGLQAWPGRVSRVLSAALTAMAFSLRPHAILFLPALAWAVVEGADRPRARLRLLNWSLMWAAFTAAAFAPVLIAGIADDLVRGLRIAAYGGAYNRADLTSVTRSFAEELSQPATVLAIGLLGLAMGTSRGLGRRRVVTWALALGAALWYRPVHPVSHRFLTVVLELFGAIAVAPAIAWIADQERHSSVYRAVLVGAILAELMPGPPAFCTVTATLAALRTVARREPVPLRSPPGSWAWFDLASARWYPWKDYRDTLIYLRERTSPGTMVANVLREPPFPALNGPAGRLSPFRAESGICWMWLVPIDLEPEFAEALERAGECLVVWSPEQHRYPSKLHLDRLVAVIRAHYRLEARFGRIEVWRRADAVRR